MEVCQFGCWGTVCDDGWDSNDAIVVCHQLGFDTERAIPIRGAFFGEGSGRIHLSQAQCKANDTAQRLVDCDIDKNGINGCLHSQDAGVICSG